MAVEIGPVSLQLLTRVEVRERARLARHAVPGMDADIVQVLGRPSVEVLLHGVFYGPGAGEDLKQLRAAYLGQEPVDFFAEAVGDGYFAKVLITRLDVAQASGHVDELGFACEVVEYAEPPALGGVDALAAIDTELAGQALAAMDSVQNALDTVSKLSDLMASFPSFADPTEPVKEMTEGLTATTGLAKSGLAALAGVLSGDGAT